MAFLFGFVLSFAGQTTHTQIASRAVLRRDLNGVFPSGRFTASIIVGLKRGRRSRESLRLIDLGANCSVRANHRALIALDTDTRVPQRYFFGDRPSSPTAQNR